MCWQYSTEWQALYWFTYFTLIVSITLSWLPFFLVLVSCSHGLCTRSAHLKLHGQGCAEVRRGVLILSHYTKHCCLLSSCSYIQCGEMLPSLSHCRQDGLRVALSLLPLCDAYSSCSLCLVENVVGKTPKLFSFFSSPLPHPRRALTHAVG